MRNEFDDIGVKLQIAQTDSADIELFANEGGDFLFIGHRSHRDQSLLQPPLVLIDQAQSLRELIVADLASLDQHCSQFFRIRHSPQ